MMRRTTSLYDVLARMPTEVGLSPEESSAFAHVVDVLVPALVNQAAEVMPFEPGFEKDALRGAAWRNRSRDDVIAVPLLFMVGAAQVPVVVRGTDEEVTSLLEETLAIGARPVLQADFLHRAGVPPHALPVALKKRLMTSSGGNA